MICRPSGFGVIIAFLCSYPASAGEMFDTFTVDDGLNHNQVNALAQDSLGFLWIATPDGLSRFDGYTFAQYRHDYADTISLPANFVSSLYVDRAGTLWAGTFNGLCRYDPAIDGFIRVMLREQRQRDTDAFYSVVNIHESADSTLWISTDRGVFLLRAGLHLPAPLTRPSGDPYRLRSPVTCFVQDPWEEQKIWLGFQRGGIAVFDRARSLLFGFVLTERESQLLAGSWITTILPDTSIPGERVLWLSTARKGLLKLNLYGEENDSARIVRANNRRVTAAQLHILSLVRDHRGSLWVGTVGDGVREMRMHGGGLQSASAGRLQEFTITAILQDFSGNMWFGTNDGVHRLVQRRREMQHLIPPSPQGLRQRGTAAARGVTSLFQDRHDIIWVGTQLGRIYALHPRRDSIGLFSEAGVNQKLALGFAVTAIHEMRPYPGLLWIGTYGRGLFRWNVSSGETIRMQCSPDDSSTLSSDRINCITEDSDGMLWIGTDTGLNMMDPVTLRARRFVSRSPLKSRADTSHLLSNTIWTLASDNTSRSLWIGTVGGWLSQFHLTSHSFTHFTDARTPALTNRSVPSLLLDDSGIVWIGTYSGGLRRLDLRSRSIREYSTHEGLPNTMIVGILKGPGGSLWLSSNNGLSRFDPASATVLNLEKNDGLQSNQFYRNACLKEKSGALLFGGPNGVTRFFPDSIRMNMHPPRVLLTHVHLPGEQHDILANITDSSSIELSHTENSLLFEFLAIELTNPKRNSYAYMLEGADRSWVYCGARRNATYANLSPGRYTFRVRASNNDGVWNDRGVVLTLNILPPFWRTGWFLLAGISSFLFAVFAVYRFRLRSQITRRLEIERIREEERESVRIKTARDFHDEMGHRLTRIAMLTQTANRKLAESPAEATELLAVIRENADHLFNGTRDFLWSLDSRNDSLFDLAARLKDFGDELFYKSGIAFQTKGITEDLQSIHLTMELRRQLILIFKEALTNAANHARCDRVEVAFAVQNHELTVTLQDNGKGFSLTRRQAGMGITSMQARAASIGGTLQVDTTPSGTRVSCCCVLESS
jgi:ligand-binding sensor domain-containing protein/signal transduction histidine kinase